MLPNVLDTCSVSGTSVQRSLFGPFHFLYFHCPLAFSDVRPRGEMHTYSSVWDHLSCSVEIFERLYDDVQTSL